METKERDRLNWANRKVLSQKSTGSKKKEERTKNPNKGLKYWTRHFAIYLLSSGLSPSWPSIPGWRPWMTVSHNVTITSATATLFGVFAGDISHSSLESNNASWFIHGWFLLYVVLGVVIGSTTLYKSSLSWKPTILSAMRVTIIQYNCLNHSKSNRKKAKIMGFHSPPLVTHTESPWYATRETRTLHFHSPANLG